MLNVSVLKAPAPGVPGSAGPDTPPSENHRQDRPLSRLTVLLFALLSLLAPAAVFPLLETDSVTSDEAIHLVAGLDQPPLHAPRLNLEHPPLSKLLAAQAVKGGVGSPVQDARSAPRPPDPWAYARDVVFHGPIPAETLLFWGRLPTLLFLYGVVLLGALWSARLYGAAAGGLTLVLLLADPTLLAHGHLITNDVAFTFFFLLTLWTLGKWRAPESTHAPSAPLEWPRVLLLALALAGALGTKFSGAILIPVAGGWLLWHQRTRALPTLLGVALLTSLLLAGLYGGEPFSPWLRGVSSMQQGWHQYLWGEISTRGWYHYFLAAWSIKTPTATVLLFLLALVSVGRSARRSAQDQALRREEWLLLGSAGLFVLIASASRIGIGVRHILPATVLVPVLVGRLLEPSAGPTPSSPLRLRLKTLLPISFLAGLTVLEVALAAPHFLSFAGALSGAPSQLYRSLSDSNLDWGQDYGRLMRWAKDNARDGLLTGVFTGMPLDASEKQYGVPLQPLPGFGAQTQQEKALPALPPRVLVAMSALNLQGVYLTPEGPFGPIPGISPELYAFLLERPPLVRLTPAIWIWEVTDDADALLRLGMISLRFGWEKSALLLLERTLLMRPNEERLREGVQRLRQSLLSPEPPSPEPPLP